MSTRLSQRNARLVRSFPDLARVPEEKRRQVYRKAVLHPIVLVTVFFLGFFVLPYGLEFLIVFFEIPLEISDTVSTAKIIALLGVPFCVIFFLLKKILLPHALRRVLRKEGY